MKKVSMIHAALLGSASALGYNWIYDRPYLFERSRKNDLLFQPIDQEAYEEADNTFNVYPGFQLGDVDFMGEVLYVFNKFITENPQGSPLEWRNTLYNHLHEGGPYNGYIESYGKELLSQVKHEKEYQKEPKIFTDHIDKQLVVPLFLLATYENPNIKNKIHDILPHLKTLTKYPLSSDLMMMFLKLFELLETESKEKALKKAIQYAPVEYKESLEKALSMNDINEFIFNHAGIACGLEQSIPLIIYIVAHFDHWEDALRENVILGGASSARGIFISAIFNHISGINEQYIDLLKHSV